MARSPRRDFLRTVGGLGAFAVSAEMLWRAPRAFSQQADPILAGRPLVRYPEKTDLILMTSRPPQLETPMTYFDRAITPNEAFFVRYHTFPVPTGVDLGTWRLRVTGLVERPLELSLEDLKTRFPKAAVTAVTQCAGNSRGRFSPRVLGGGWGDGAMAKAGWEAARPAEPLAPPCGCVEPGTAPKSTVPIHRMTVRSFIVVPPSGARVAAGRPVTLKGIAFDGGYGAREVQVSDDAGATWRRAQLGPDLGRYSFREWSAVWTPPGAGGYTLMVRALNAIGESQGSEPLWNPAGYLRNVVEHCGVHAGSEAR